MPDSVEHLISTFTGDNRVGHVVTSYRQMANNCKPKLMKQTSHINTDEGTAFEFQANDSISACLTELHKELENRFRGLHICAVGGPNGSYKNTYSFPCETYLVIRYKDDEAGKAVNVIIAYFLSKLGGATTGDQEMIKAVLL